MIRLQMPCRLMLLLLAGYVLSVPLSVHGETGLFDPTRPLSTGSSAPRRGLVLESTIISPGRTMAIINGRLLSVGDNINGATVVAINPYTVRLRKKKRNITLRLVPKVTHNKSTKKGKDK